MCKWVRVSRGCKYLPPVLVVVLTGVSPLSSLWVVEGCDLSFSSLLLVAGLDPRGISVL